MENKSEILNFTDWKKVKGLHESAATGIIECTIDKFFSWYTGEGGTVDSSIFDAATYGNDHAQDGKNEGKELWEKLEKSKDQKVKIEILADDQGTFDCIFDFEGQLFTIQASPETADDAEEIGIEICKSESNDWAW